MRRNSESSLYAVQPGSWVAIRGLNVEDTVRNTALAIAARYAEVWLDGSGAYTFYDSDLSGSASLGNGSTVVHGNAVFACNGVAAWEGSTGLLLDGNRFHDSDRIAVMLEAASATFLDNRWQNNVEDLVQQSCAGLTPLIAAQVSGVSTTDICAGGARLYDTSLHYDGLYLSESTPADGASGVLIEIP